MSRGRKNILKTPRTSTGKIADMPQTKNAELELYSMTGGRGLIKVKRDFSYTTLSFASVSTHLKCDVQINALQRREFAKVLKVLLNSKTSKQLPVVFEDGVSLGKKVGAKTPIGGGLTLVLSCPAQYEAEQTHLRPFYITVSRYNMDTVILSKEDTEKLLQVLA